MKAKDKKDLLETWKRTVKLASYDDTIEEWLDCIPVDEETHICGECGHTFYTTNCYCAECLVGMGMEQERERCAKICEDMAKDEERVCKMRTGVSCALQVAANKIRGE